MKTYFGIKGDDLYAVVVEEPGQETYSLPWRTEVINHSPTGFCWGYGGSGPSQLALALLIDCLGDVDQAKHYYQPFKSDVIARFSMKCNWRMTEQEIESTVTNYKLAEMFQ
jgi:Family of unknown function (DUF6166)